MTWKVETHEQYLAAPGLQSSALKELALRTPAHYFHRIHNPRTTTPAMEFGTKVHAALLENAPLIVRPDFDRRTKEGKAGFLEFQQLHANSLFVTEDEAQKVGAMRESVFALEGVGEAIAHGFVERSGYGNLRGHAVKIRPDILHNGVIYDLKTTTNAAPDSFAREVVNFGYHIQAALYLAIANVIEPGCASEYRWIAVEKEGPNCASLFVASEDFIQIGMVAVVEALTKLAACTASKEWIGYPLAPVELAPPAWATRNMGDFE